MPATGTSAATHRAVSSHCDEFRLNQVRFRDSYSCAKDAWKILVSSSPVNSREFQVVHFRVHGMHAALFTP